MGEVSPLDFFKSDTEYADSETVESRLAICAECPDLLPVIGVCKHCGCVMKLKTRLAEATCPKGKW